MSKLLGRLMIALISVYKKGISRLLPASCRYYPTCSEYGIEAIRKYGPFKGGYLTIKRILSCNPFGGHGHDPVP